MTEYPNPCDTCQEVGTCVRGYGCEAWKIRYLHRQKQINAYARRLTHPKTDEYRAAFLYEHPDIVRQYLENGPCVYCGAAETCDIPCPIYWRWWDERMEWLKGVWGM